MVYCDIFKPRLCHPGIFRVECLVQLQQVFLNPEQVTENTVLYIAFNFFLHYAFSALFCNILFLLYKKTALYSRITQYYFIIKNYAYILHFLRKYSFLSSSSACFSCGSFLIISLYPIFSISGVSILFQKIYIQPVLP